MPANSRDPISRTKRDRSRGLIVAGLPRSGAEQILAKGEVVNYIAMHIIAIYELTQKEAMKSELGAAFTFELATAGRKMRKLFDRKVREQGLTLPRARALLLLAQERSWNQTELADALEIEHPSVVRLLDGLERQGLIVRCVVAGDRRAKQVELTAAAQEQIRELSELTERMRIELLAGIDAAALEVALSTLRRFVANAEQASAAQRVEERDVGR